MIINIRDYPYGKVSEKLKEAAKMKERSKPKKCDNCNKKEQRYIEWYEFHEMWLCDECNEEIGMQKSYSLISGYGYKTTEGN